MRNFQIQEQGTLQERLKRVVRWFATSARMVIHLFREYNRQTGATHPPGLGIDFHRRQYHHPLQFRLASQLSGRVGDCAGPRTVVELSHLCMRSGTRWVIIDTETDGLYEPIHVVEIAGQLMEGWNPVGEPFRMLLNHEVPIPHEAFAIHGYTREYLSRHGHKPVEVYEQFRSYAQDYPLVAHNLSFDWNRCLEPEWARLGVSRIGQRGFCSMTLARRLVHETRGYRLDALKQCFKLSVSQAHRAQNDVLTVVELFQRVYRSRLESAQLDTFESVAAFAKRTPVAKCLEFIRNPAAAMAAQKQGKRKREGVGRTRRTASGQACNNAEVSH